MLEMLHPGGLPIILPPIRVSLELGLESRQPRLHRSVDCVLEGRKNILLNHLRLLQPFEHLRFDIGQQADVLVLKLYLRANLLNPF